MEVSKNIKWSKRLENHFKDIGEKSYCYSYLHKKAEAKYAYYRNFIDLPVIVLSTVAGTLSIGKDSIFGKENEQEASLGVGMLSLVVGVMNTIGTYFQFAKRAEAHRLSHIEFSKLFRFISIELSLPRDERMRPSDLLKVVRDNYERLQEVAPLIPEKITNNFKKMFKHYKVSKPSEANGLEEIDIFNEYDELSDNEHDNNIKKIKYHNAKYVTSQFDNHDNNNAKKYIDFDTNTGNYIDKYNNDDSNNDDNKQNNNSKLENIIMQQNYMPNEVNKDNDVSLNIV